MLTAVTQQFFNVWNSTFYISHNKKKFRTKGFLMSGESGEGWALKES